MIKQRKFSQPVLAQVQRFGSKFNQPGFSTLFPYFLQPESSVMANRGITHPPEYVSSCGGEWLLTTE